MKPAYLECVIFCPKHAKTHLRAYTGPKNFFRLASARHKGEGGGEGREGGGGGEGGGRGRGVEGKGRGEGRGRGRGRGGRFPGLAPPPLLNPKYATGHSRLTRDKDSGTFNEKADQPCSPTFSNRR